jgi:hypothetical protein
MGRKPKWLKIPAPKFEVHEVVCLHWNETSRKVRLTACWHNIHHTDFWYEIYGEDGTKYPESAFDYQGVDDDD